MAGKPLNPIDLLDRMADLIAQARGFEMAMCGASSLDDGEWDALESLGEAPLQAALLDIYLFNGTSFDVARELRRRGVRFAFMTGLVAPDVVPADLAESPIILKPYNEKELLAFVAT